MGRNTKPDPSTGNNTKPVSSTRNNTKASYIHKKQYKYKANTMQYKTIYIFKTL